MSEKLDAETKKCLLCVHIPFEYLVSISEKIIEDKNKAYNIAENAARLIKNIYMKKPYALCGKSYKSLAGAALYISANIDSDKIIITQGQISAVVEVGEPTIRVNYKLMCKLLGVSTEMINKQKDVGHICHTCAKRFDYHQNIIRFSYNGINGKSYTGRVSCCNNCLKKTVKNIKHIYDNWNFKLGSKQFRITSIIQDDKIKEIES